MKETFFVKTLFIFIASIIIIVFASIFFQNCRTALNWQRTFISSIPYERQKWFGSDIISSGETGSNSRPGIARGLIKKNILVGKSQKEIIEMLGKSEGQKVSSYKLEEIYAENIDPIAYEVLNITFDDNEKVEKAEIEFQKTGDW